ncbi:MAG: gliding-motility protein MglA [Gemmatimonadetes bacterium]|nr:MAG: gliding-motility protein MglA [Gemmatimonadota bacterium]
MALINFAQRQIMTKIVYYGPGMSGKTSNLEYIYSKVPEAQRKKMVSVATELERTIFFDFFPMDVGTIAGLKVIFQLYTVPGQVYYSSTRRLVLDGADGIIFVADSQAFRLQANIESFRDLYENLASYKVDIRKIPIIIQYNKRDLDTALPVSELEEKLNYRYLPSFEATAHTGEGVFETLKAVTTRVLDNLRKEFDRK